MNNANKTDSFDWLVYRCVQQIPRGRVSTYGRIAEACGCPRGARAVGMALHRNPQPGKVPCHRVVNREGRLAPAFAFGGTDEQRRLLEDEGVAVSPEGYVDLTKYLAQNRLSPDSSHIQQEESPEVCRFDRIDD